MRRTFGSFLGFVLVLAFLLFLVSCGDTEECQHSWGNETVLTEATCISEGETEYTCTLCGQTYREKTAKTAHTRSTDYKTEADGHSVYCTVCGEVIEKCEHDMTDDGIEKEPTAYEPGIMRTKCSVCGYESAREIAVTPHNMGTEYKSDKEYHWHLCTAHENCTVILQKEKHSFVEGEILKEATNEADGLRKITCSVCGYEDEQIIPAMHHSKGTCVYDDTYHWYTCSGHEDCKAELDKAPHTFEEQTSIPATCTSDGSITYKCTGCDKTKTVVLPALQHDFLHTEAKAPTCTEIGWNAYDECTRCGYTTKEEIPALDHDYSTVNTDPAGHYQTCSRCAESTELLPHTMTDNGVHTEPTDENNGIMNTICSVCGYESTREIPALSHTSSGQYASDEEYHWHTCNAHEGCTAQLDKEAHIWESIENTATCTEAGMITYQCAVCGRTRTEASEPYHLYGELVLRQEKTCTENGMLAHYQCSRCNLYFNSELEQTAEEALLIPAGHELIQVDAKAPTCTEAGWEAYEMCTQCDYTTKQEIEASGHSYTVWTVTEPATLYSKGTETKCCACGDKSAETRELEAKADFSSDFSTDNSDGTWKYGTVSYQWGESETFTFTPFTDKTAGGDGWTADNTEVKFGWINAGNMLGIAYTFTQDICFKTVLRFTGSTAETRLAVRIGIKDESGVLYGNPAFYGMDSNGLELELNYEVKAGDTVYFIFSNEATAESAYPNGDLSLTLRKTPDFINDFSTDNSDGTWKYGTVSYQWGESETFTFTPFTDKTVGGDGWTADNTEVKSGWINAGNMLGIAYTATEDTALKTILRFTGSTEETRLAVRIGIKDESGVLYGNPAFYGMDSNELVLELSYEVKAGDTVYFIFSNEATAEGAYPSGDLNIIIA